MFSSLIGGVFAAIIVTGFNPVQDRLLSNPKVNGVDGIVGASREIESSETGYIFLGDSRTVGMNLACNIDSVDDEFVVAKVGQGLDWYNSYAKFEIDDIVNNNTEYDDWVIISNLGVNDLYNIDNYIDMYENIQDNGFELYLVSVNPVCDDYYYMTQEILDFNTKIHEVVDENHWIDTYNILINKGFSSRDGLHYGNSTYRLIYDTIEECL